MKTFDEALKLIGCDKRNKKEVYLLEERVSRYTDLIREIENHELIDALITSILQHTKGEPFSGLLTAFCNGVVVGIEMEKQDVA